jgi:arsenate reductase
MFQIYHNPHCRISRQVLEKIQKSGVEIEVIEYLKNIPSVQELKVLLMKLNLKPQQIFRTEEKYYKQKLKGKNFTEEEWLQILHENPSLIERPIVIRKNKALVCRPAERVEEIL